MLGRMIPTGSRLQWRWQCELADIAVGTSLGMDELSRQPEPEPEPECGQQNAPSDFDEEVDLIRLSDYEEAISDHDRKRSMAKRVRRRYIVRPRSFLLATNKRKDSWRRPTVEVQ
jgi:hypothetical protein